MSVQYLSNVQKYSQNGSANSPYPASDIKDIIENEALKNNELKGQENN